jgi:hypothetical protein
MKGIRIRGTLLGLLFFGGAALAAAQSSDSRAIVSEIYGTVEVKAPGQTEWTTATPGQVLERAAMISTRFKSSAIIVIGNSTLQVRPLTRLSLEELISAENAEQIDVSLVTGRVRAEVNPPAGGKTDFTVRSPSATASVRGTVFEFDGRRLSVAEGRVYVSGSSQVGTYVSAGHKANADVQTGKILGAAENAREELIPAAPAGTNSGASEQAVPAIQAPSTLDVGIGWK